MSKSQHERACSLAELAERVGGTVRGDGRVPIRGVATIDEATPADLTWAVGPTFEQRLSTSRAGAVVGRMDLPAMPMPALLVRDVDNAIADILAYFQFPLHRPEAGIHATAVIDPSAQLGNGAAVGPHVVVGPRTRIGRNTILHAGVWIGADVLIGDDCEFWPHVFLGDRCRIGSRVCAWPNAVIGRDGFGFIFRQGRHRRIPQVGMVAIEDDVEIGAGACIDRAKCGITFIGAGTKIDNLVQVAHNVRTGPHCILVGQAGVSGSVRLGAGVILAGQVGVADGLEIGEQTQVTAQSGVTKSLPARIVADGKPAQERMAALREQAAVRRLPKLLEQIRDLTRRVQELETSANHRKAD